MSAKKLKSSSKSTKKTKTKISSKSSRKKTSKIRSSKKTKSKKDNSMEEFEFLVAGNSLDEIKRNNSSIEIILGKLRNDSSYNKLFAEILTVGLSIDPEEGINLARQVIWQEAYEAGLTLIDKKKKTIIDEAGIFKFDEWRTLRLTDENEKARARFELLEKSGFVSATLEYIKSLGIN